MVVNIEQPKTAWDIATTELIKVGLDDNLSEVVRQMAQMHITSLPIVEDKRVIGFVSESTVVKIVDKAFEHGGALIDKGDASATPLGIITAWDLHKIDK